MADELLLQPSMDLKVVAGRANTNLAEAVAGILKLKPSERSLMRFPDGELHVELRDTVRGADVYLLQPTGPPVEEHLFELLLLADACRARRGGAPDCGHSGRRLGAPESSLGQSTTCIAASHYRR
jgi:hypothetical protein